MTPLRLRTPGRLHFGLLGWGPQAARQYGGVGLMVQDPGIELRCHAGAEWSVEGPLAGRVRDLVERLSQEHRGRLVPATIEVVSAPPEHTGLGVGTQLSLAVARALLELSGLSPPSLEELVELTGRGRRSGVGLHGFRHGGLIVDGGRRDSFRPPPLIARHEFPVDWSILLIHPPGPRGRHGSEEIQSFAALPPLPDRVTEKLCRIILLGLLPSLIERELRDFGASLTELQEHVGAAFAPLQGGPYASPMSEPLLEDLARLGLVGTGQSSWGPTLYAFGQPSEADRARIGERICDRFGLEPAAVRWTRAANQGAVVERLDN